MEADMAWPENRWWTGSVRLSRESATGYRSHCSPTATPGSPVDGLPNSVQANQAVFWRELVAADAPGLPGLAERRVDTQAGRGRAPHALPEAVGRGLDKRQGKMGASLSAALGMCRCRPSWPGRG